MASPLARRTCFITADPDGNTVALEARCWYGHILIRHKKQMGHRLMDIKLTIEKPDRIDDFNSANNRNRVYFKRWKDRDPFGQEYLKVPTEMVTAKSYRVLTAHPLAILPPKKGKKP